METEAKESPAQECKRLSMKKNKELSSAFYKQIDDAEEHILKEVKKIAETKGEYHMTFRWTQFEDQISNSAYLKNKDNCLIYPENSSLAFTMISDLDCRLRGHGFLVSRGRNVGDRESRDVLNISWGGL